MDVQGVSLSTANSVAEQGVSLSTANSVAEQGVSLSTANSVDVQVVSLSTASSMGLGMQGVSLSTASSIDVQEKATAFFSLPILAETIRWLTSSFPLKKQLFKLTKIPEIPYLNW